MSNQCSVTGFNTELLSAINFLFLLFIHCFFFFCALPYAIFPETNITKHHFSRRSPPPRIYRGDVRRYKTSPPSFSMRRKLIGLCWLLWRYCLWWLPLAVLSFGPLPWFTMLKLHGGLLWRPWTVFGALWVFLSIILSWFFNPCKRWSITVTLPQHLWGTDYHDMLY